MISYLFGAVVIKFNLRILTIRAEFGDATFSKLDSKERDPYRECLENTWYPSPITDFVPP